MTANLQQPKPQGGARRAVVRLARRVRARVRAAAKMQPAIVAVSLVLIALTWAAALLQSERERTSAIDSAVRQNSNLAIAFEEHSVRSIRGVDEAVHLVAREYERDGNKLNIAKLVEEGLIDGRLFTNIAVVDERGNLVVSSQALQRLNVADREYFKAHAADPSTELHIGKPIVSRTYSNAAIPMTRRINRDDGSFAGVVAALVDPMYFLHFYEKANVGKDGVVHLVGLDGVARARRAGSVATVGTDMSKSKLMLHASSASSGAYLTNGRVEGVPRYQSFRRLAHYPLIVAVGMAEDEVLADYRRNRRSYCVAAAVFSLLVILFGALLAGAVRRQEGALAALSASETQFRATFEQAAIGLAHTTPDERFIRVNEKLCRMLGYTREELLRMTIYDLSHPDDLGNGTENRRRLIAGEIGTHTIERRARCKDGTFKWIKRTISAVRDAAGAVQYFIRVMEDITDTKRLEHALQHTASHDRLTGLPNRALIHDRLRQVVEQAARRERIAGVMFIDLDRFKLVNDTLGHAMGDKLLQNIAARVRGRVRGEDTVGRLGGDEFAVVLTELADVADAELVAQKVIDTLATAVDLDGHETFVTASIGIATYPRDGADADTLIRNADVAMYRAKAEGKNKYRVYSDAMDEQAAERLRLENSLRHAIARDELVLHFQPKAAVGTGHVTGVEALLRWQPAGSPLVPPGQFIPILEESGLIVPVGEWVLRRACAQLAAWREEGIVDVPIAVNLSARQFRRQDLADVVRRALDEHGVAPHLLELEITESAAMDDPQAAAEALRTLKALGVRIAIDDFGTGHSSLSYLKRFPIDSLKIDRSFVHGVPEDPEDASIAQAIITMAHALGLSVVAEGVETAAQVEFLGRHGCDELQGYYLARPIPAEACTRLLLQVRGGSIIPEGRARRVA